MIHLRKYLIHVAAVPDRGRVDPTVFAKFADFGLSVTIVWFIIPEAAEASILVVAVITSSVDDSDINI